MALPTGPGFGGALSRFPVILTGGLIIAFVLARQNTGLAENLADASLATIVMRIMISIVTLYSNFGPSSDYNFIEPHVFFQNTNYANYCLLYGASLYVFSFLLSLRTNEVDEINFTGKKIEKGFVDFAEIKFKVDPFKKKCLLEGLDDIALSLGKSDKIENFEKDLKNNKPWIFND